MSSFLPLTTPIYYSLELTSQCSGHCQPCSNVFSRLREPLPLEAWEQILQQIAPYAETIKVTGGEPTLHPQFAEIIRLIARAGRPLTVFTNARWSAPGRIVDLFTSLPPGPRGFLISLHGPDAASHAAFTGAPDSFHETCANISLATGAGLRVHTITVITDANFDRLTEVVRLSQTLGARSAVFNRYLGPAAPGLELSEDHFRHAVSAIEALRRSCAEPSSPFTVKYGNCIPQCFTVSSSSGCWAGVASCTIDPWGNLRPCNHSPTIAGNILEEALEGIWRNETLNRWRELLPEQCSRCDALDTCHGGCRALSEIRQGDPLIRQAVQSLGGRLLVELTLYQNSFPVLACRIQPEPFGYALIRGSAILQVTHQAKEVLDQLNGTQTLQQIQADLGQEALDFVGTLYGYQMVELPNSRR